MRAAEGGAHPQPQRSQHAFAPARIMIVDGAAAESLRAEGARFVASGALGRSGVLLRLFDFLLDRSVAGAPPKEIEVAAEVFGRLPAAAAIDDASVRVHIYRLRKKLDDYYAAAPPSGARLSIPRGEYRIAFAEPGTIAPVGEEPSASAELPPADQPPSDPPSPRWRWMALGAAPLLVLLAVAVWLLVADRMRGDPALAARELAPWSAIDARWPTTIVLGDYYIFGEMDASGTLKRLVREFRVNSREDLDDLLMVDPALIGRYADLDLHFLPVGASAALHEIDPLVRAAGTSQAGSPRLVTASELTAAQARDSNIVYVGYMNGLGSVATLALGGSHFVNGPHFGELVDRSTGRHYRADWSRYVKSKGATRDYAYLASIRSPAGPRVIVVGGTHNAGLVQAAEIARDPARLRDLAGRVGGADAFEAVWEVQTLGNTNLSSRLIAAYRLAAAEPGTAAAPPAR